MLREMNAHTRFEIRCVPTLAVVIGSDGLELGASCFACKR